MTLLEIETPRTIADARFTSALERRRRLPGNSQALDVGVDAWDYRPALLDEVLARLATLPVLPDPETPAGRPGRGPVVTDDEVDEVLGFRAGTVLDEGAALDAVGSEAELSSLPRFPRHALSRVDVPAGLAADCRDLPAVVDAAAVWSTARGAQVGVSWRRRST